MKCSVSIGTYDDTSLEVSIRVLNSNDQVVYIANPPPGYMNKLVQKIYGAGCSF